MAAKSKMAAKICVVIWIFRHCLTFDISAQESNVIPHFQIIWVLSDHVEVVLFSFQGHIEAKITTNANVRHYNQSILQAIIV